MTDRDSYERRGWFWRGRKEVFACLRCGALVLDGDRDTHDEWHRYIERVEQDAFQGGGLIG